MNACDNIKIVGVNLFLATNSIAIWLNETNLALKLICTIIAIPVAYYSAKSFYWQARKRKAEAISEEYKVEKLTKKRGG